ncbi:MAG: hypothetical protein ACRDSP_22925 [Pseudonocardiaceae bacterium]
MRLDVTEAQFELTLLRADEYAHPEEWDRPPELRLYVESTTFHRQTPLRRILPTLPTL